MKTLNTRIILSCAAALSLAMVATAQVRVSEPMPTGAGPSSDVNPDSGASAPTPAAATQERGGALGGYQGSAPGDQTSGLTAPELSQDSGELLDEDLTGEDLAGENGPRRGYDPQGRRDPFRPLTGEAADTEKRAQYEGMLQGRLLAEVKLTSIVRTTSGNIATFEGGPKKEGYFARVGDKFWDGQVIDINYDSHTVVVRQQLDDPRLIKPYRDQVIALYGDADEQKRSESGAGN